MNDLFRFWVLKRWPADTKWPADTSSHVFLGNAVNLIGKAFFGSEWNGDEPGVELMQPLPKQKLEGSGGRQHFANDLLVRHHPEFGRKLPRRPITISGGFSSMPASFSFTDEEWAAAYAIVARDREAKRPAIERFSRVKATIIRLAEAEQLATALRPVLGGDPVPVHRSLWNSERLDVRFYCCRMNRREPFGPAVYGDNFEYIFVTRESLDRCIAVLTAPGQPGGAEVVAPAPPKVMTPKRPRGRVQGEGSFADVDTPILDEMKELILSRKAASAGEAARLLVGKAHGPGSPESKIARLARRYRAREAEFKSSAADQDSAL